MSLKKKAGKKLRKKAVSLPPQIAVLFQQAQAAHQANRIPQAMQAYHQVAASVPDFAEAHFLLGVLYLQQGVFAKAQPLLVKACQLQGLNLDFHNALGNLYFKVGDYAEALKVYRHCEKLAPNNTSILASLGACQLKLRQFGEAKTTLKRAHSLNPDNLEVANNLGSALVGCHEIEEALEVFRAACKRFPDSAALRSNLLFNSNYSTALSADELFSLHKDSFNSLGAHPLAERTANEKIRLGFVSADFRRHSVAYFFLALLETLDRSKFEVYCYYNHGSEDDMTVRIRALSDVWRGIFSLDDRQVHRGILNDQVDILVDLAGHTQNNRSGVFAQRAAPVQVSWLGYPHSTGIPAMDYRLADAVTDPLEQADRHATETLIRLGDCFLCYQGDDSLAYQPELPVSKNGHWTFGSFNNLAKVNAEVVSAWSQVMNSVPNSRMIIKARQLGEKQVQDWLLSEFKSHGIEAGRLELLETVADFSGHMALYGRIDLALDSFPYNGTTTTCEALWMGVPTVTFSGDRHASRVSASILHSAGLDEFVATSAQGYCELALAWTKQERKLADMRATLRDQVKASVLCDAGRFSKNMQAAFEQMLELVFSLQIEG